MTPLATISELVGTFRSFGSFGPVYEVIGGGREGSLRIRVVETGEELDYPLKECLSDPEVC